MTRRGILAAGGVAGLAGLGIGIGYAQYLRPDTPALAADLGAAPGRLIDHEGRAVGFPDLVGRTALVFFGFTSCPDICPTTLGRIAVWLDALGDDLARLTPVFVTVDPARDDVGVMAAYVSAFHPAIRGWTGPETEIARAAEALRVSYRTVPLSGGGYTMDTPPARCCSAPRAVS